MPYSVGNSQTGIIYLHTIARLFPLLSY